MKNYILIIIFIFSFSYSVISQDEKTENFVDCGLVDCATVTIIPPQSKFIQSGENITFTVSVIGGSANSFTIDWSVDKGQIIAGQGTPVITVSTNGLSEEKLTVKVKIKENEFCDSSATETVTVTDGGDPTLIDEFGKQTPEEIRQKFDYLLEELKKISPSKSYIVNYGTEAEAFERETFFRSLIAEKKLSENEIEFVYGGERDEILTRLWIQPKPLSMKCPTISVTPPPAAVLPGELLTFTANVVWENSKEVKVEYEWSAENGEIADGQGTPTTRIKTQENGSTLYATVKIKGLPDECRHTATESASFDEAPKSILFDDFGDATNGDIKARLDSFFIELLQDANATGYIVSYGTPRNLARRESIIRDFIKHRNFQSSRIVFVNGGTEKEIRTRLWIVPAGADPSEVN